MSARGKHSCTSSSVAVALPSVSILSRWLQRDSVPVFMLCAVFSLAYLTICYLLQAASYLFVAGVARVAYFMALGWLMRSLKDISLGIECV